MTALSVSVVVVSRGRAADLALCLTGISQLSYPMFEVILVADPQGIRSAQGLPFFDSLKTVEFDEPNISAARNLGIAQAAGDIVAFIDDDAVPEPTWLTHLTAAFAAPEVACAGGFVRGRNGISYQWKARSIDIRAETYPLEVVEVGVTVLKPQPARAIKTEGTNMALRREVIAQMGGFDPAYRFYLDESDVNMRLARAGHKTAIVPQAQVHHGYKASATRRNDRVPRDLFEIGASLAVYLGSYAGADQQGAMTQARAEQRARLLRHMVSGALEPRDVRWLLARFDAGAKAGAQRERGALPVLSRATCGFAAMPQRFDAATRVFATRHRRCMIAKEAASDAVSAGARAMVICLSRTARPHRVRFVMPGIWLQSGGIFGRSLRSGPHLVGTGFRNRVVQEVRRIAGLRGIFNTNLQNDEIGNKPAFEYTIDMF